MQEVFVSNTQMKMLTVYLTDTEDWKGLRETIKNEVKSAKEDKTHAFVLKRLDDETIVHENEELKF